MVCEFTQASCPFDGCYKVLNRNQLDEHKENCQFRLVTCNECSRKYDSKNVSNFSQKIFFNEYHIKNTLYQLQVILLTLFG